MKFTVLPRSMIIISCLMLGACSNGSDGGTALTENGGNWTFINYWAKWCKPCIKEIPELNALHAHPDYEVLGVNFDGASGEELQTQIDALGVAFPTLDRDPAADFGVNRPQVLPTTLVIRPNGSLARILIGPQTEASLIAATEVNKAINPVAAPNSTSGN